MLINETGRTNAVWITVGVVLSYVLLYPIHLNNDFFVVLDKQFFVDGVLEYNCWPDQLRKSRALFENLGCPPEHLGCHAGNMAFRFTIPILLKVFGFDGQLVYFFQLFLGIFFIYGVYQLALRISQKQFLAVGFLLCFISTNAGQAIVYDFRAWGDAFSFMFLFFAAVSRNRILQFLFFQVAFWTDERSLIAGLGVALFWLCQSNEETLKRFSSLKAIFEFLTKNQQVIVLILSYATYFILRQYLTVYVGLRTPKEDANFSILGYYAHFRTIIPVLLTHKFFIVYIVIGALYLIRIQAWLALAGYFGFMLLYHLVAHMVYDTSRSMAFGYFIYFIAFNFSCRYLSENAARKFMWASLAVTILIFPLRHIIF
jgi:hypothetical protein